MHRTAVFVQEACYSHKYIRTRDDSGIFERPERLRSVALGLAAAISRLEEIEHRHGQGSTKVSSAEAALPSTAQLLSPLPPNQDITRNSGRDADSELSSALDRLTINPGGSDLANEMKLQINEVQIVKSTGRSSLLSDPAVKFIHGDIEGCVGVLTLRHSLTVYP